MKILSALQPRHNRPKKAFTLIELLVVVAVLGILSAILFSTIRSMRMVSERTKSAANIRQILAGLNLFADANQGRYPGPARGGQWQARWLHQTAVYMGFPETGIGPGNQPVYNKAYRETIFHNPRTSPHLYNDGDGNSRGLYGLSEAISAWDESDDATARMLGANRNEITNPAQTILLAELAYDGEGYGVHKELPYPSASNGAAANWREDGLPEKGPDGKALYGYVDGRVALLEEWPGPEAFTLRK